MHTLLDYDGCLPVYVNLTDGKVCDAKAAKEIVFPRDSVVVADCAYVDFENLYSYLPYHNIKRDVNYPAMLIMTSDNDERVPPLHSYKFVASMQNRKAQKNPILLRVNKNAGHYGSSNIRKSIREMCDKYGFIMEMLKQK